MDAQIVEVIVTLDRRWENDFSGALKLVQGAGLDVSSADDDNNVVSGTIDARKLGELEKLECVKYCRTVMTYCAEYPPGDPRDTNGV